MTKEKSSCMNPYQSLIGKKECNSVFGIVLLFRILLYVYIHALALKRVHTHTTLNNVQITSSQLGLPFKYYYLNRMSFTLSWTRVMRTISMKAQILNLLKQRKNCSGKKQLKKNINLIKIQSTKILIFMKLNILNSKH